MDGGVLRRDRHHLRAAPGDRADIEIAAAVGVDHLLLGSAQLFGAVGNGEIQQVRPISGSARNARRLVDLAGIGALALEHRAAVMQSVREHMQLGVAPGNQFAVQPDEAVAVVKWKNGHRRTPSCRL
jgi:hypothetical protein